MRQRKLKSASKITVTYVLINVRDTCAILEHVTRVWACFKILILKSHHVQLICDKTIKVDFVVNSLVFSLLYAY